MHWQELQEIESQVNAMSNLTDRLIQSGVTAERVNDLRLAARNVLNFCEDSLYEMAAEKLENLWGNRPESKR